MPTSVLHNTNTATVPLLYEDRWNSGAHFVHSKELIFQVGSFHDIVMQVDVVYEVAGVALVAMIPGTFVSVGKL